MGKFTEAGNDGDLSPSVNIWKKGIVFTNRAARHHISPGYRISAAFKRGWSRERGAVAFKDLYDRVNSIAGRRVSELFSANSQLDRRASIVCHGWLLLAEGGRPASVEEGGKVASAFVTLALREAGSDPAADGERPPTDADLRVPGGTNLEDMARFQPQRAAEVYNEFDFSDSKDHPITVSFGETINPAEDRALDFGPSVERAEAFARTYHGMLASFGEVDAPFQIVRREWFLADSGFVTVHVCFAR